MDVVNKIAKVAKGAASRAAARRSPADVPTEPVVIKSARVIDAAK